MRALVTGAGGFLGRYLTELLVEQGAQVRALCRGEYPFLRALGAEVVRADLSDPQATASACQGVDVVYHAAAKAGVWGPWPEYYASNVLGTQHVIAGCWQHGVGKLVFTSSPSVTFDGADQNGVDERAPYARRWLCHYARTKAMAEQAVLAANSPGRLLTCALRPHLIWGPRDPHLVPRLLERARRGRLRRIGSGRNLVDMIYVDNAARAHLLAAERLTAGSPVAGAAYFLSQGEPVCLWPWIDQLLARCKLPAVRGHVPLRVAWCLGAACEAAYRAGNLPGEPPLTRFVAAQLGRSHYFDIERARRELGYTPTVSMAQGLERLLVSLPPAGPCGVPPR